MNPHAPHPASPIHLLRSLWHNRQLIRQMTWRDVIGRYKGSAMGLLWSFITPLLMLSVYSFVFIGIFKSRWGTDPNEHKGQFAIVLFTGMIVHALLSDVLNRAPSLILANVNYVKKVIFPLETLVVISTGAALFHALVSLVVLLAASIFLNGALPWTALYLPLILAPLVILALGLGWLLASLGVFVRDIGQSIGLVTTVMMFLSPVFYPITHLPEEYRIYLMANPISFIVLQTREVLIWGNTPDWYGLGIYTVIALSIACLGYAWFQKTRKGFADVL